MRYPRGSGSDEYRFDVWWEVGVARLPAAPGRVLALWNAEAVVITVGCSLDVFRVNLWNLEGTESDVATELDDEIIARVHRRATQLLEFVVGHLDLVFVRLGGRLQSHSRF